MDNRIKELRKKHNLTQKELCVHINVTQSTLSGYENGAYQPDYEVLCKIASFFNVSIDYLLNRQETNDTDIDKNKVILFNQNGEKVQYELSAVEREAIITILNGKKNK